MSKSDPFLVIYGKNQQTNTWQKIGQTECAKSVPATTIAVEGAECVCPWLAVLCVFVVLWFVLCAVCCVLCAACYVLRDVCAVLLCALSVCVCCVLRCAALVFVNLWRCVCTQG